MSRRSLDRQLKEIYEKNISSIKNYLKEVKYVCTKAGMVLKIK